jgi:hypothetical protein
MEAVEILFLIPDSLPFEERQMRLGQWTATRHMIRLFGADPRTHLLFNWDYPYVIEPNCSVKVGCNRTVMGLTPPKKCTRTHA